jgi:hypothetical protein
MPRSWMETLPGAPFYEWVEARLREIEATSDESPYEILGYRLGVAADTLYKRMTSRRTQFLERPAVEDMLDRAGVSLWEVFDPADLEAPSDTRPLKPLVTWMRPETLQQARAMYEVGASLREVGGALLGTSGYKAHRSFYGALAREFENQGWPMRSRSEAMRLSYFPPSSCEGIAEGRRCQRAAVKGGQFCLAHDSEWRQERDLALAHARRIQAEGRLPLGPFKAWLRVRIAEAGSCRALARRWGVSAPQLAQLARARRTANGVVYPIRRIERSTVERLLAADGTTTFEQLYGDKAKAA